MNEQTILYNDWHILTQYTCKNSEQKENAHVWKGSIPRVKFVSLTTREYSKVGLI